MIDRTLIALLGGLIGGLAILVGGWIVVSAYAVVGWQIPLAAGIAVAIALWTIDALTDYLASRQQ